METTEVLKKAWAAVTDAELPTELHAVAFREAVQLITGSNAVRQSSSSGRSIDVRVADAKKSSGSAEVGSEPAKAEISDAELVAKVAQGTGASETALEQLVYIDDGELRINLPGIKLGPNNAERTRAIASVITIVRSFGLDEDETSFEIVRDEAQRLKCYDSANFTAHLKALQGYVLKGAGSSRRIQAKAGAIADFPALVSKLAGES